MSRLETLWYQLRPKELTLSDFATAINGMLLCLGAPGSGKSRLLVALARAYIASGYSVLLIDTGLDVFRQVLAFCIRAEEVSPERVVIMDATQPYPVPDLCPLAVPPDLPRETIVDSFLATWRGFLSDGLGPRQEDIMRMLATTLIAANAPYFPYAVEFLTNERIRNSILKRAAEKRLTEYWNHMTSQGSFSTWVESARNKLHSASSNRLVSSFYDSNAPSFDFYEGFNRGDIVLLNASDNFYQDRSSQALLCSTMLFQAHQALLRRESMPMAERRPVAILCDEVSRYFVSDFILPHVVLGRKYGGGNQIIYSINTPTPC